MAGSVARALYDEVARAANAMGYHTAACGAAAPPAPEQRLPLDALLRLLADIERRSGDPHIGLRLGRALRPAAVGVPGYLAMAGPTLLDALPRVMEYQRLVADGVSLRVATAGDELRFHITYQDVPPSRALSDLLVAATRFFGAWLLGSEPPLAAVWFHYPQPSRATAHREVLGSLPRFAAGDDGFALARSWFSEPLRTAEASLVPVLEAQAGRLLARLGEDGFVNRVADAIAAQLDAGQPAGMADVAARLETAPRSLQRHLRARSTTFNRVLQQVRLQLADRYLTDARLSLIEIAGRLGYQEQSSFCHAYRQWTGHAPSAARRAATTAAAPAPRGRRR